MDITSIQIDYDEITLGDMEDFEEKTGRSLEAFIKTVKKAGKLDELPVKELRALIWIFGRKDNDAVTWESTRDIKLTDFDNLLVSSQARAKPARTTASQKRAAKRQTAKAG